MNVSRSIAALNDAELSKGVELQSSWHNDFRDTAWIYIGGLPVRLTEGDVLRVFSQYGEIEDFNLVRDRETGERKGFAFLKYEDWRSTVLAVDNLNAIKLLGRVLQVDHTRYEPPKRKKEEEEKMADDEKVRRMQPGHAYLDQETEGRFDLNHGLSMTKIEEKAKARGLKEASGWEAVALGPKKQKRERKSNKKHKRRKRNRSRSRTRRGSPERRDGQEAGKSLSDDVDQSNHRDKLKRSRGRSRSRKRSRGRSRRSTNDKEKMESHRNSDKGTEQRPNSSENRKRRTRSKSNDRRERSKTSSRIDRKWPRSREHRPRSQRR